MADWELKCYLGREIKTSEDIIWVCEKLKERAENGDMSMEDIAASHYIKSLHQEHIDAGYFGIIKDRFEILDL